ncbi:hypothetical protein [Thalassospira permensis]|uniref:Uncharacterized protein n=1 Tax=Thalassospira permensis NBRC 106175 TaxID=1353532 RepID=A0ABR4TQD6_9PROT|nr:hypothetical protein [Thalassospira permensis]KEO57343.1 hypothetical protein SMB34_16315 [Thalassospira permensis NBRC 106175]
MPRISGPELRPDWIGTGSAAGVPGWLAGSGWQDRLSAVRWCVGHAERPVIDGGICVPAIRQRCGPWGEVRFGATESERRSGRGPSSRWRLAMPGAEGLVGWRDWFGD